MTALSIQPTYPIFTDIDGQPLEDGYVWIGQANLDPQGNPIQVYWDAALTILAAQPIRTLAGYPANNGTPARLYVNSDYSIRVMNKNGSVVYSALTATERYSDVVISGVNAANVDYDPPFTNSVATNVELKLSEIVSVKDFGAVGDGLTNDTTAMQAAVNAMAGVGAVFFPAGTYLGYIDVPDNTVLYGEGENSIIKLPTAANRAVIQSLDTSGGNDDVQIFRLCVDGNRSGQSNLIAHGINIDGACKNWLVTQCKITNTYGHGIQGRGGGVPANVANADNIRIIDNYFYSCGNPSAGVNGRESIYFNQVQYGEIIGNTIDESGRQSIAMEGSALQPTATRKIIVSNNIIRNALAGGVDDEANNGGEFIFTNNVIYDCPGAGVRATGLTGNTIVANNVIRNVGTGIDLQNVQSLNPTSLVVANNIIETTSGDGIYINSFSYVTVTGNSVRNVGDYGLFSTGDPNISCKITNNTFVNTVNIGLFVGRECNSLLISGNTVIDAGTVAQVYPAYYITALPATVIENLVCENNAAIDTRGTPYMEYGFVFGNLQGASITGNSVVNADTGDVEWIGTSTDVLEYGNQWDHSTFVLTGTYATRIQSTAFGNVVGTWGAFGTAGNNAEIARLKLGLATSRNGASVVGYRGVSSNVYDLRLYAYNSGDIPLMQGFSTGHIGSGTDTTQTFGTAAYRWSEIFAVNPIINTSDATEKQQIQELSEQERRVALRLKTLLRTYKWNSAVEKKGDQARIHVGLTAQSVAEAFAAEGLDADRYSMFCRDTWHEYNGAVVPVDENGEYVNEWYEVDGKEYVPTEGIALPENAILKVERHKTVQKTRLGVRYEQTYGFILAAL
jgi:hypothetical protein